MQKEELIKNVLLLSLKDRNDLLRVLQSSIESTGEGFMITHITLPEDSTNELKQRLRDIQEENPCLIEFDDHLLTIGRK